jgi:DNA-binding NarL/FixJ family response regulator
VLGAAGDGEQALSLARRLHPDVILMDLRMPRCNGLTATRLIKAELPEIKIVILTTSTEDQDLFEAIKSGACGYLLKSVNSDEFIESLRGLDEGYPPFSPGLAAKILDEFSRLSSPAAAEAAPADSTPGLTERQSEVLALAAQGFTYKEIGSKLNLGPRTVKYHMQEIIQRLHLENRAQALAYAARMQKP